MFGIDTHRLLDQFIYHEDQPLIFNSGFFLFLFVAFLLVYNSLSKTDRPKIIFVTLFSFYFYYKSSGFYFILLLTTIFFDFYLAKWIYLSNKHWKKYSLIV